jgi:phosphoribosyl 1,2-cyclic phosphodiesterase
MQTAVNLGTITPIASSSSGNCYLLDGEILLDAGVSIQRIRSAIGFQVTQLQLAAISHEHSDHTKGIPSLLKLGVDVFATPGTIEALGIEHHRLHALTDEPLVRSGWTIRHYPIQHDAKEPVCFALSKGITNVLYLTDAGKMPDLTHVAPYTHVLIEANHRASELMWRLDAGDTHVTRVLHNHLSLEAAIEGVARLPLAAGAEVWLTHMSAKNGHAGEFQAEVQAALGGRADVMVAPE